MCDSSIRCDTLLPRCLYMSTSPNARLTALQQLQKKKKKHSNPSLRHAGTAAKPFSCSIDTQNREEGLRDRHIVKGVGKYKGRLNEGQRLSSEQLL